ncbi:hypothetical protein O181_028859 [Austropuccinia psidii MF-1]|uniref:Uncharacterized protein n=1 Tax=Austropuccinia psidii MF-1 TaxID=1389203 RepID=A0A9Q3H411_9BASI|nr:hypothetical protein [Austropuccinia psidii MF-1]
MHVSEGSGSTPEISSKANPQLKFPREFLLHPGRNPVASQDPFGQSKQPTLNIPSGSQIWHLNASQSDFRTQLKIISDELYASSPLVHKENVTGRHHPYASKPKTGHVSSSREKKVDDEDENMSPTQSERNDEPRRDNFTAHEQGTQSNSSLTHPQMPLSWICLINMR